MYEYSFQLNWPSEYDRKAWGYEVCKFHSIFILSQKQILDELEKRKQTKILEEIKDGLYLCLPKFKDGDKERFKCLTTKSTDHSCFFTIKLLD
jgi:hypothetical protein